MTQIWTRLRSEGKLPAMLEIKQLITLTDAVICLTIILY